MLQPHSPTSKRRCHGLPVISYKHPSSPALRSVLKGEESNSQFEYSSISTFHQPLTRCFRPVSFRSNVTPVATGRLASKMSKESIVEHNWIPDVETLSSYRPGGYRPVMIGDTLHDRYTIVDKLGFGGYATVWLARDTHQNQYVALKINISSVHPREAQSLRAVSAPARRYFTLQLLGLEGGAGPRPLWVHHRGGQMGVPGRRALTN